MAALPTLVLNKIRGTFSIVAVKAPGFGDRRKAMLENICHLDRWNSHYEDLSWNSRMRPLKHPDQASKVTVDKDSTVIVEGSGEAAHEKRTKTRCA